MSLGVTDTLATLRDLPGVGGSFLVSASGELLGRDMPAYYDDGSLCEVGPRVARVFEAWSAEQAGAECVIRFEEQRLYLRAIERGFLCALIGRDVQLPAMRTATSLVARRLSRPSPAPGAASPAPGAAAKPERPAQPPPLPTAHDARNSPSTYESPRRRVRVYRGQRFEY